MDNWGSVVDQSSARDAGLDSFAAGTRDVEKSS